MSRYYELIKESKTVSRAKKLRFDQSQRVYFASCHNHAGIQILSEASGLLLTLSDGRKSLAEIVQQLSSTFRVAESAVEDTVVIEVRNLQRKHLLYLEV